MTSLSSATEGRTSATVAQDAGNEARPFVGLADVRESALSDTSREREAYRAMAEAFIEWHTHGDFLAAAGYTNARTAWELALMEKGKP